MKTKIKMLVVVTFIVMIVVNALANILPINGVNTGSVSDSFPNLFAPAGLTFAIWGLIYFLLAGYTFYQLGIINKNDKSKNLLDKIGVVFSISSIANAVWIFTWHYKIIYVSIVLMAIILICLIIIVNLIRKENLSLKEKIFVKLPFSIYFGWITVATIANITTLLVSLNWDGFGIAEGIWTVIIVSVGAITGILTIMRNKDYAYGSVIVWAYIGILIKHTSLSGFNNMYPEVIITVIISLVLIVVANVYAVLKKAY